MGIKDFGFYYLKLDVFKRQSIVVVSLDLSIDRSKIKDFDRANL